MAIGPQYNSVNTLAANTSIYIPFQSQPLRNKLFQGLNYGAVLLSEAHATASVSHVDKLLVWRCVHVFPPHFIL